MSWIKDANHARSDARDQLCSGVAPADVVRDTKTSLGRVMARGQARDQTLGSGLHLTIVFLWYGEKEHMGQAVHLVS